MCALAEPPLLDEVAVAAAAPLECEVPVAEVAPAAEEAPLVTVAELAAADPEADPAVDWAAPGTLVATVVVGRMVAARGCPHCVHWERSVRVSKQQVGGVTPPEGSQKAQS